MSHVTTCHSPAAYVLFFTFGFFKVLESWFLGHVFSTMLEFIKGNDNKCFKSIC